jgi:hypothetical protein
MWLEDDHDDFSTSYASTPVMATHWMPLPEPPLSPTAGRPSLPPNLEER